MDLILTIFRALRCECIINEISYDLRLVTTGNNPDFNFFILCNRVAAAKEADRLLNVKGVHASFALVEVGNAVHVSGRSDGSINVQLIAEQLGGGGHFDMAGAQLKGTSLKYAVSLLKDAVDDYLDHDLADGN